MIEFSPDAGRFAALEAVERDAWLDSYAVAEQAAGAALQVAHAVQSGAALTAMRAINFGLFNRAQGLGCDGPFSDSDATAAIAWLRAHCAPDWRFQLVPASLPHGFESGALGLGLSPKGRGPAKLYRDSSPLPDTEPDAGLQVRKVSRDDAERCVDVVRSAYGLPPAFMDLGLGLVERKDWHPYAAFDDGVPIAFGTMFVKGEWAWLGWGTTLSRHRGKGAQSALLRRRVADGIALGVKHFATECAAPSDGDRADGASYRNIVRAGFSEAYVRVAYGPT